MTAEKRNKYFIITIATIVATITYLHYFTVPRLQSLHDLYRAFYYIPTLLGALFFGLEGAIVTYLCILLLYVPYLYISWTGIPIHEADRLLHLFLQGFVSILAGFLIDRERRQREQLEKQKYLAGIGQVASNIVHDLKNPLITIRGFSRRILEGKGDTHAAAQEIADSAQQMEKIVYDVLDFAKPLELDLKTEDLRAVIEKASRLCMTKAEEQGITILAELPSRALYADVDGSYIERAVTNLINNAIEASERKQKVIVSAEVERKHLIIKIRDSGHGMDQRTIDNAFVPFYTKKKGGSGLGMPISKKIIDAHKGRIEISSRPGKGTEIRIGLPLSRPAPAN